MTEAPDERWRDRYRRSGRRVVEPLNTGHAPVPSVAGQQSGSQGMMKMIWGRPGRVRIRLDHYGHIDLSKLKSGGY